MKNILTFIIIIQYHVKDVGLAVIAMFLDSS